MKKISNFFSEGAVIILYVLICLVCFFVNLLSMSLNQLTFDWGTFLYKSLFNNLIILAIFVVGYPDGKAKQKEDKGFQAEATELNNNIKKISMDGKNMVFRTHCDIWNNNETYLAIKNILEVECGLTLEWYFYDEDILKKKLKDKEIDRRRYRLIVNAQKHRFYAPKVNANKILTADTSTEKIKYTMNETIDMFFILGPKLILTILTAALFSINLNELEVLFSAQGIFQALGSLLTALMAIVFSRKAGATIIDKRRIMFHRWNGFIEQFFKEPLKEDNKFILKNK